MIKSIVSWFHRFIPGNIINNAKTEKMVSRQHNKNFK
jgi:hypothetical protein